MASLVRYKNKNKKQNNGYSRNANYDALITKSLGGLTLNAGYSNIQEVTVTKKKCFVKHPVKVANNTKPAGVTLVDVDKSGSMRGSRDADANNGVKTILTTSKKVGKANDSLSVATFSSKVKVPLGYTSPDNIYTSKCLKKLAADTPSGGTRMRDCILERFNYLNPAMMRNKGQKYVEHLVISDGYDNSSRTTVAQLRAGIDAVTRTLPNYHLTLVLVGNDSDGKQQMEAIARGKSNVHVMHIEMAKGAFVKACKKWLAKSAKRVETYVEVTTVKMTTKSTGSKTRGGFIKALRM